MKKTNSILTLLLTLSLSAFSQTNDVATLSKGRYIEVFENDTLQRIGSVMFNTVSNKDLWMPKWRPKFEFYAGMKSYEAYFQRSFLKLVK